MFLFLAASAAIMSGCSAKVPADTVPPQRARVRDTVPPNPRPYEGGATFELRIDSATAIMRLVPGSDSGDIVPVVAAQAFFDLQRGVVQIPIAIQNNGQLRMYGPTAVEIAAGGVSVSDGSKEGAAQVRIADAAVNGRGILLDSVLPAVTRWAPVRRYVPARAQSNVLIIPLTVPASVRAVRIRFRASGRQRFTIGPEPPAGVAASVLAWETATVYTHGEFGRVHVTRNAIFLRYKGGISMEDRQAALDAVDGVVIGGFLGEYFVRVPEAADSGAGPLFSAIRILKALPQVQGATIDAQDLNGPN